MTAPFLFTGKTARLDAPAVAPFVFYFVESLLFSRSEIAGEVIEQNREVVIRQRGAFIDHVDQQVLPFLARRAVLSNPMQIVTASADVQENPSAVAVW